MLLFQLSKSTLQRFHGSSRPIAGFKGVASWRWEEGTEIRNEGEERSRKGEEGEEMLTLMRSCCQTAT